MKMMMHISRSNGMSFPAVQARSQVITTPGRGDGRSALLQPMVSRVHKAKPGCSACGKK